MRQASPEPAETQGKLVASLNRLAEFVIVSTSPLLRTPLPHSSALDRLPSQSTRNTWRTFACRSGPRLRSLPLGSRLADPPEDTGSRTFRDEQPIRETAAIDRRPNGGAVPACRDSVSPSSIAVRVQPTIFGRLSATRRLCASVRTAAAAAAATVLPATTEPAATIPTSALPAKHGFR